MPFARIDIGYLAVEDGDTLAFIGIMGRNGTHGRPRLHPDKSE
jgi:hypothetical protein